MNAIKHSLTGDGIAIPTEDAEEVERRFEALRAELRPGSELARHLVGRVALLMTRLDRSAGLEARSIRHRMRRAEAEFDAARRAEADRLIASIAAEPAANARRLRAMPEGIDRLVEAIGRLRADLARPNGYLWSDGHSERLHHLLGLRPADRPASRVRSLTDAIAGKLPESGVVDGEPSGADARRVRAIGELVYLMDDEVAALEALRGGIDAEAIGWDRDDAAALATFDPSKEAVLARKYEAANERSMFRTLREFREVQAETQSNPEVAAELGSFFPEAPPDEDETADVDSTEPGGGRMAAESPSEGDPGAMGPTTLADPSDPAGG